MNLTTMNSEDLKVIWFCRECGTSFVFRSDVEDHEKNQRHSKISKYNLSSYTDMGVGIGVERI